MVEHTLLWRSHGCAVFRNVVAQLEVMVVQFFSTLAQLEVMVVQNVT